MIHTHMFCGTLVQAFPLQFEKMKAAHHQWLNFLYSFPLAGIPERIKLSRSSQLHRAERPEEGLGRGDENIISQLF